MKRFVVSLGLLLGTTLPALAQSSGQIVIPDDGSQIVEGGPAPLQGSTEFIMKPITVEGQNQLRGRFGGAWAEGEIKQRAALTCGEAGMRLIYFKAETPDSKSRREFAAVCQ
ncbi:hypothetical protein [Sagittula sp. SSi028]|uniref:hypothetical protein n=1 Tax=Sagittula sp. SSi028 TaxID=3400636 RepID=UPI003AF71F09